MPPVPVGSTRVPELPDPFVPRARLLTVLDDEPSRTTLVCAPAGFGKTALLAHWARATATARPVAWANLSSATGNLWDPVLPALLSCSGVPEDSLLHELARRAPASANTSFTADVLAALDALPRQVALVLHDVHEIVAPTARATIEALLTVRPAGVRLILCSRWDTPSLIWGMRSAGHLSEIRADRLRFSVDETRELLRLSKLDLDVEQVRELHARIDGWPIGARLACVALRAVRHAVLADETVLRALPDARSSGALRARTAPLDGIERELLLRLPSALSIDQIARELRIPPTEASTRIRAIYRKLGVSSRRSAVSVAHEEGLLH